MEHNPIVGKTADETFNRLVYCTYNLAQQLQGFEGVIIEDLNDIEQHELTMKVNAVAINAECYQAALEAGYCQHSSELSAVQAELAAAQEQAKDQIKAAFDQGFKKGKKKGCKGKKKRNKKSAKKNNKPIEATPANDKKSK